MNQEQKFEKRLKEIRNDNNLDKIANDMLSTITLHGLTTDEVCALAYYIVDQTLRTKSNKEFLSKVGIDIDQLDIAGELQVMRAMVNNYVDKVSGSHDT